MNMKAHLEELGVELKPRSIWWATRLMGYFGQSEWWMTIGKTIYYSDDEENPYEQVHIIEHELTHVRQYDNKIPDWLDVFIYLCLPFPCLFSYFRWRWEREAYLRDIKAGRRLEDVVNILWRGYFFTWPPPLMRKWFVKQLKKGDRL